MPYTTSISQPSSPSSENKSFEEEVRRNIDKRRDINGTFSEHSTVPHNILKDEGAEGNNFIRKTLLINIFILVHDFPFNFFPEEAFRVKLLELGQIIQ